MNHQFLKQWNELKSEAKNPGIKDLQSMFASNDRRSHDLSFEVSDILADFSKNWINKAVLQKLIELGQSAELENKINALFEGSEINFTEKKAATHTKQRAHNATGKMITNRQKMLAVAKNYQTGKWLTAFGKKVKTVVNIGIGGSYLGPKLAVEALTNLQTKNEIKILFYPSVDSATLESIIQSCDISSTLFCIGSKSLGTIETARNTETVLSLLNKTDGYNPTPSKQSFVAASANIEKAQDLNIPETHVMPFDTATGGRFSVWSSIGFPVLMATGEEAFLRFLSGAEIMDKHFQNTKLEKNLPVVMALVSIWNRNFMALPAYAVIPYDMRLQNFPAWLQQLMMESNGKMVDINGQHLDKTTSPWVFGDHGQLSQHAFFQAFHQGKDEIPIDFIGVIEPKDSNQDFLLINMLSQSAALMAGNKEGASHNHCPGNRPSTTLLINGLKSESLGQLLALYEHMVFVQSIIWNINCFDQPGVELGKKMARQIVQHMKQGNIEEMNLDKSTFKLLTRVLKNGE